MYFRSVQLWLTFYEGIKEESKMLCNYGGKINSAAVSWHDGAKEIIYLISMTRIFREIEKVALTRRHLRDNDI